jgi:hypothetical protein
MNGWCRSLVLHPSGFNVRSVQNHPKISLPCIETMYGTGRSQRYGAGVPATWHLIPGVSAERETPNILVVLDSLFHFFKIGLQRG